MFGHWHVTEAMIVYGGSFVQGLGRLFRQADETNKRKLLEAFPEYFAEYTELARTREAELETKELRGLVGRSDRMYLRLRYKQLGGHIHCRLFTSTTLADGTWQKGGDLVFNEKEWTDARAKFERIGEVREEEPCK